MATPDKETEERIRNLAFVGTALYRETSSIGHQTPQYVALEALEKFHKGIDRLDLDEESRQGMHVLIERLREEIKEKLKDSLELEGDGT